MDIQKLIKIVRYVYKEFVPTFFWSFRLPTAFLIFFCTFELRKLLQTLGKNYYVNNVSRLINLNFLKKLRIKRCPLRRIKLFRRSNFNIWAINRWFGRYKYWNFHLKLFHNWILPIRRILAYGVHLPNRCGPVGSKRQEGHKLDKWSCT